MLASALAEEASRKGWAFERFYEHLMAREPDFIQKLKHARSEIGEIDYVYAHNLQDDAFWRVSSYICVECKNWVDNITSNEMHHLTELIREKGPLSCCGVFITSSSYDPSAVTAMRDARIRDKILIIPIEGKDLEDLIEYGFKDLVRKLCEQKVFKR